MNEGIHYASRRIASVHLVARSMAVVMYGAPWSEWRLIGSSWYVAGGETERVPVDHLITEGFRPVERERWTRWAYSVRLYHEKKIDLTELGRAWEEFLE
jgi:hypothetical protein